MKTEEQRHQESLARIAEIEQEIHAKYPNAALHRVRTLAREQLALEEGEVRQQVEALVDGLYPNAAKRKEAPLNRLPPVTPNANANPGDDPELELIDRAKARVKESASTHAPLNLQDAMLAVLKEDPKLKERVQKQRQAQFSE